jgi:antitoxin YefM
MSDTLPLAAVKNRFSEIVDRVNRQHDRVVVTRNGIPSAVLLSIDELESLEETLEVLSDPEAMAAIREAEAEIAAGRDETITEAEARVRWVR